MTTGEPAPGWLRADGEASILAVRVTPRAAADAVDGIVTADDGAQWLAVRVRAVPDKGQANRAVSKVLADAVGVRKSAVEVISGTTARLKRVRIDCPVAEVRAAIGG